MSYVKISTLQILESQDIIKENPNLSFPNMAWTDDILIPIGYAELNDDGERPTSGRYQKIILGTPKKRKGKWYKTFIVEDLSSEEIVKINTDKILEVLTARNQLLAESDWSQFPDVNLSNKEEWVTYRQELRDITSQSGYPWNVTFPYAPPQ
jgi:hypothetical protein